MLDIQVGDLVQVRDDAKGIAKHWYGKKGIVQKVLVDGEPKRFQVYMVEGLIDGKTQIFKNIELEAQEAKSTLTHMKPPREIFEVLHAAEALQIKIPWVVRNWWWTETCKDQELKEQPNENPTQIT